MDCKNVVAVTDSLRYSALLEEAALLIRQVCVYLKHRNSDLSGNKTKSFSANERFRNFDPCFYDFACFYGNNTMKFKPTDYKI